MRDLLTRCAFPPSGTSVTCAVSGGPDSTALVALAVAAGLQVTAVHVDHGLRIGSANEATVVRRTCERLGAAFEAITVHVGDGPNLEARAREARYAALPHDVLTGHTADDQAETLLLNLLRGTGLAGLGAMEPTWRRPLLSLRRADTVALCASLGLDVVHDPSNTDPRHLRNRVRHELLPLMADLAHRDMVPLLTRLANVARDDHQLLDTLATIDPTDAKALTAAPPAIARRVVRQWLTDTYPPDLASVERVLEVARGDVVACELPGGRRVERSGQRLRLVACNDGHRSE